MGPNGAGKSTLANVLAGREGYEVSGTATLDGVDLLDLDPEDRATAGLFLAFQYPIELPGVGNIYFLRTAVNAQPPGPRPPRDQRDRLPRRRPASTWPQLDMDPAFLSRSVNEGFSGGEKKRNEILQMSLLRPRLAILDETDSGLDIDALRIVARGIERAARPGPLDAGDHPLPAAARPVASRPGARARGRSNRSIRWSLARLRARGSRLRQRTGRNTGMSTPNTTATRLPGTTNEGERAQRWLIRPRATDRPRGALALHAGGRHRAPVSPGRCRPSRPTCRPSSSMPPRADTAPPGSWS